jgi:Protein of unknown function (DUF3237)
MVRFDYTGIIALSPATAAIFAEKEDAKTTDYGDACELALFVAVVARTNAADLLVVVTHCKFETGNEELKALESHVYVASGRFILEPGKPLTVEYKISQVTA